MLSPLVYKAVLVGLCNVLPAYGNPLQRRAQAPYAQCGGIGWTGETTCESGWTCVYSNDYYSQCLQSSGSTTKAASSSTTAATTTTAAAARVPTVYLCGDSTMAKGGGGSGTEGVRNTPSGDVPTSLIAWCSSAPAVLTQIHILETNIMCELQWGQYLQYSFSKSAAIVSNQAIAGRSARSFTREGRFDTVANLLQSGDWVVIEFGHNDGGSLTPTDNGRTDCFGDGTQTCSTVYNGVTETVLTFPAYLKNAANKMLAKGAKVILSHATPNNVWESGTWSWNPDRFFYYDWLAVSQLGGPSKGAYFVPHGEYAAQAMKNLGAATVNANYPNDHTHTAPYLADVMARAFVLGLKCGTSPLGSLALNSTSSLTSTFLGPCISGFNSTVNGVLK